MRAEKRGASDPKDEFANTLDTEIQAGQAAGNVIFQPRLAAGISTNGKTPKAQRMKPKLKVQAGKDKRTKPKVASKPTSPGAAASKRRTRGGKARTKRVTA